MRGVDRRLSRRWGVGGARLSPSPALEGECPRGHMSGVEIGGKEGVCLAAGIPLGDVNLGDRKYNKTSPC